MECEPNNEGDTTTTAKLDPLLHSMSWAEYSRQNLRKLQGPNFLRVLNNGVRCQCAFPFFVCNQDCIASTLKDQRIAFYIDESYYIRNRTSKIFLDAEFVRSFAAMTAHLYHRQGIQLVHTTTATKGNFGAPIILKEGTERVISILCGESHFAVSEIKLSPVVREKIPREMSITVYDGKEYPASSWQFVLADLCARLGNPVWDDIPITNTSRLIFQADGYQCGYIACMVVWHLFSGQDEFYEVPLAEWGRSSELRSTILSHYKEMLAEIDVDLRYRHRPSKNRGMGQSTYGTIGYSLVARHLS